MKISSTNVGGMPRTDSARSAPRSEQPSRAFSLKGKSAAGAAAKSERGERTELRTATAEAPVAAALRSVAADYKAGNIPSREEAVRRMVSTMLHEQFGSKMTNDRGFQKMEQSIADVITDDPMLSRRMESLLQRLA